MKMFTKFGNWIFHYRNFLFPLFYAALFIPSPAIFQGEGLALITGLVFIITGMLTRSITIGLVYIIRGGAKRQIHAETLVTEGIYKVCRNPMYLGNILLIFGFGLFANSLIFTLLFFPLFVLFYVAIINAEEEFLLRKFNQQFIDYKSNSNSIIPKLGNLKTAFKGHTFNWKNVIYKEYNSLFIYCSGICLLLLYHEHIVLKSFLIIETTLLIIYLLTKYLKYKK
jgi:protein-S-isoprenylcysteine O-methyltransferase Ste14